MPPFPSTPLHKPQFHPFPPTPLLLLLSLPSPKPPTSLLTFPPRTLSLSLSLSFHSTQTQSSTSSDDHVIGDCIVFEDGAFEDPYLQDSSSFTDDEPIDKKKKKKKKSREPIIEEVNLVPEKWAELKAEYNITKRERRRILQEAEFGRRLEKKDVAIPLKETQEFLVYREMKLRQLRPRVLDDPHIDLDERVSGDESGSEGGDESGNGNGELGSGCSSSGRAAPRNPRLAVYGRGLDDIAEFFNSGSYNSEEKKPEGRRKLFTKEEKVLLNKRVPNLADATSEKWLPLHTLAASGEFYLVDALLKHNADINAADKDGLTALHRAILCKKQAVTNYLLRELANPFFRDKEGATLMHYAVQTASIPAIKTLLLYNVDINLADEYGWTPLHLAILTRRTDMVRLLLIKGADKTLRNKDGLTPIELCLYSGRHTRTYELVKLLKELPKSQQPKQSIGSC
ncbi:hypothetical protein Sjap_017411 [Stephania japonica]|uniref:Ankyrin repeat domain-containing protein, chloroplastic n=1 Tax=Stephania japonica TaxID=461633 RepID=A0AAP0I677_9MAGN